MEKEKLKRIVAFCILMEGGKGIVNKAPSYIEEKFNALIEGKAELPRNYLDLINNKKFDEYFKRWGENKNGYEIS